MEIAAAITCNGLGAPATPLLWRLLIDVPAPRKGAEVCCNKSGFSNVKAMRIVSHRFFVIF